MAESANPFLGITYGAALARLAALHGDREALVFDHRRFTFAELKAEADRHSASLWALGLRPNDKVAMWLPNRVDYVFFWLGACQIGLIGVMLNTRLKRDEIAYQLGQSDSRALIVPGAGAFRDFLADIFALCPEIASTTPSTFASAAFPELRRVICCDPPPHEFPGLTDWPATLRSAPPMPPPATDPDTPALLSYSSGTTALPKGALITHCIWRKAWDMGARIDLAQDDCLYLTLPMFGSMATMNGFLQFWVRGARVVLEDHFDARKCLATIDAERCTVIHLLPTMVQRMCAHPERQRFRLDSLRVAFVLSIDLAILGMVEDDLGVRSVLTGYGMTETSTVVTRNRWDDPREVRFTTQGKPLPGLEIMIADPESGAPLPAETAGEVLVRGYAVTPGYYRKDAEFAKVMRSDGWFRTGDKAVLTAEGRISFQSRLGDDYKSRGFNVSPSEIEAVMATHPMVHAVAVVGVPDTEHGTVGVAFVIPRQGQHCDESEMLEFLRPKLANFKIPRHVLSVSEFPLTEATGKVQKFKLRQLAVARCS